MRDFSIKEEIRIILKENNIILEVEDIYNEVECDELLMDIITLSIFDTIKTKLKDKNEEVEYQIEKIKDDIIKILIHKGLI